MVGQIWERIENGQDVRQNLSRLRQELREWGARELFLRDLAGSLEGLEGLLFHEDTKTRKNAALLIGDLRVQECLDGLYRAYGAETQLFVRSAYLTAMRGLDCRDLLPDLRGRLEELGCMEVSAEQEKHCREEMRELSALLVEQEGIVRHVFCGWDEACFVILLTNRNFTERILDRLVEQEPQSKAKVFGAGVMARVEDLRWVEKIRTYQELLFVVDGMRNCPMDAERAADVMAASDLLPFLERMHGGKGPFYFRLELKSRMELDKRGVFAKRLASRLERLTNRSLVNSPSDYEVEIRLVENKEGSFNLMVKLFTWVDGRFDYRKEDVASSIKPVNAALVMELAKDYLMEGARVLDPFCGVGTMLIERHKTVKAESSYGVDIQEEAVEKARLNAEAARQVIHFINRDFFDFTHEYLFDEIISDMPFAMGRLTEEDVEGIYRRFFERASGLLKKTGIVVLYTRNRALVKKYAARAGFLAVKSYECSKVEGTYVCILRQEV